jgi:hypothetical protein
MRKTKTTPTEDNPDKMKPKLSLMLLPYYNLTLDYSDNTFHNDYNPLPNPPEHDY